MVRMLLTKSPTRFGKAAIAIARARLPKYRTRFSKHDYQWPQLVACLLVRQFLNLDYRGIEQVLTEHSELRRVLGLRRVPDHTALFRALKNLTDDEIKGLMDETVSRMVLLRRRGREPKRKTVIPDSTGFRADLSSRHYWRKVRQDPRFRQYPKWSIAIDRKTKMILGQVADLGPRSDHCEFDELIREAQRRRPSNELLADAGYDSDKNLRWCEEQGLKGIIKIGVGKKVAHSWDISSKRRRRLYEHLPSQYHQRAQVESAFSAHKRRFGDVLRSRSIDHQHREQLLRGVLHNCAILPTSVHSEDRNTATGAAPARWTCSTLVKAICSHLK